MAIASAIPESGDRVRKLEQPKQGVVMAVEYWNIAAHGSVHCQYQRLIDLHNSRKDRRGLGAALLAFTTELRGYREHHRYDGKRTIGRIDLHSSDLGDHMRMFHVPIVLATPIQLDPAGLVDYRPFRNVAGITVFWVPP